MAQRPYSPSYNSYPCAPKPAPSPPTSAPPRLSSHPFFVDQTPYLSTSSRRLSSMSMQSTISSSSSRYRSPSSSSSSVASPSASAISLNWAFRKAPTERRHTRAASTSVASPPQPQTPLSPKAVSLHTPTAPIDRACLQWMREAEQHEHEWILGSVASRSSGRERVFLPDPDAPDALEVLHEPPRPAPSSCQAVKRRFRLTGSAS